MSYKYKIELDLIAKFTYHSADNSLGIFELVTWGDENSWMCSDLAILTVQSFIEANQLCDETEVGVGNWPSWFYDLVSIFKSQFLSEDHVADAKGRTSRNSLVAVHVDSASVFSGFDHELQGIVEYTLNVFSNVVL